MSKLDIKELLDALATLVKHREQSDDEAKAEVEAAGKKLNRLLSGFGMETVVYMRDRHSEVVLDTLKDKVAMMVSKDNRDIIIKVEPEVARGFASGLVFMADYAEQYKGKPLNLFQKNKILGMSHFPYEMDIEEFFPLSPEDAKQMLDILGECDLRDQLEDFLEYDGVEEDDEDEDADND